MFYEGLPKPRARLPDQVPIAQPHSSHRIEQMLDLNRWFN